MRLCYISDRRENMDLNITNFGLIQEWDRIAVGVYVGKDL
jgi:hypothetical protein